MVFCKSISVIKCSVHALSSFRAPQQIVASGENPHGPLMACVHYTRRHSVFLKK